MKIYINGEYFDRENAKVSVFDHGLLYGDGIFEGIRIYNGTIFKLKEHVKRLYASAKTIFLDIPMTETKMEKTLIEAFKENNKKEGYIRLVVTRGDGDLGIDPAKCKKANVIIIVDDISLYPKEYYENGIAVITASTQRISPASFDVRVKSLNYLNNILAKIEARQAGVLEAIMLTSQGYVAECTADNIFIVKNNYLYSPCSYHGALEGITLNTIIELAQNVKIKTEFATLTKYDLYNADECFFSGTGAELMPVVKIDGRIIANGKPGPVTKKLLNEFNSYINSYLN